MADITIENAVEHGLSSFQIEKLIVQSGNIEKYLTSEYVKKFNLSQLSLERLIIATGKIDEYLTPEKVYELKLNNNVLINLITKSKNIKSYLLEGQTEDHLNYLIHNSTIEKLIVNVIKATGRVEDYLTQENIQKYGLESEDVYKLVIQTENPEKYLITEQIKEIGLDNYDVCNLIVYIGKANKYLTVDYAREFGLNDRNISELAIAAGKIEEFLTLEKINEFGLNNGIGTGISSLIKASWKIEKYLTLEMIQEFGGLSRGNITNLIKATGRKEDYLLDDQKYDIRNLNLFSILNIIKQQGGNIEEFLRQEENLDSYSLTFQDIQLAMPKDFFSEKEAKILKDFNAESIQTVINASKENRKDVIKILERLSKSNSGELRRIKNKIAAQILQNSTDYEATLSKIEQIYLTKNVPEAGKRFLVFKELHPIFFGEETKQRKDESAANIPSLNASTPQERKHIIFSDLLICSIESNNRELREYLDVIEKGNFLYEQAIEGKLDINKLDKDGNKIKILTRYASILNTLYNLTSNGKRAENKRENKKNLIEDIQELDELFKNDENIHMNLPDRIIRTFGYWAGITSLDQAKKIMQEKRDNAYERNIKLAQSGDFKLKKGDFIKGIKNTQFFSSMLQNGIVAKDYLGESSSHDMTPLDTDVARVTEEGDSLKETLRKTGIVNMYVSSDTTNRNLGKIILVFSGEDYVETRDSKGDINVQAVEECRKDRKKKECFHNWTDKKGHQAYGFRTGDGSESIKYIISDKYNEKLGLEIALNGFYIPIVNENMEVLYTPEMFQEFRDKMQGLSYYGETTFELDKTAKNSQTEKIAQLIDKNKRNSDYKRNKIIETLRKAVEGIGMNLSQERMLDLEPGIVEFIDTGSTGRGTNEPGDGDFDFMVRMDRILSESPQHFKDLIRKELAKISNPEKSEEIGKGDFRYKGVTIDGLDKKIDLDLTFTDRTNEIEYSTEESIKDRLSTIKEESEENYKYVVANILLAKKVLKESGVYKKSNAPAPEKGKPDTRGGLGAVGIENWILQNGGSFEKASKEFLNVAGLINDDGTLNENGSAVEFKKFQEIYSIWDFGENWTSLEKDIYPHDNFINNMSIEGYQKMIVALKEYIKSVDLDRSIQNAKTMRNVDANVKISSLVQQDVSVLNDTQYMKSARAILEKSKALEMEGQSLN